MNTHAESHPPTPDTHGAVRHLTEARALRRLAFFVDFDRATLDRLARDLRPVGLAARRRLVERGAHADGLYILVSGALRADRIDADGPVPVGRIRPGEIVGDGTLLLDRPSPVRVTAARDSVLLRLSTAAAKAWLRDEPAFGVALARELARRSDTLDARIGEPIEEPAHDRVTVAVVAGPGVSGAAIGRQLTDAFRTLGPAVRLDPLRAARTLGGAALHTAPGDAGEARVSRALERMTDGARTVVMITEPHTSPWTLRCARQADVIVVATDAAAADAAPCALERAVRAARPDLTPQLLLLQPAHITRAEGTARWLADRPGVAHHHIRAGNRADVEAASRRISGRGTGLVLSGAATRGTAHLGVKWAADQLGAPLDVIAGNSSGAGIAALMAMGLPQDEVQRRAYRVTREARPVARDMGPPLVSMLSGRSLNRLLQDVFGDARLEDLLVPVTITALDLRSGARVDLTDGPIWEAVRASVSAPGFWPPVSTERGLLVDGGLVCNVPVEALLATCRHGTVLVSDLSADGGDGPFADVDRYGFELSGWSALADRILPWRRRRRVPGLYDQIIYAMCRESHLHRARLEQLGRDVDLRIITPKDRGFGFFDITAAETRRLEAQMTEAARAVMADLAAPAAEEG